MYFPDNPILADVELKRFAIKMPTFFRVISIKCRNKEGVMKVLRARIKIVYYQFEWINYAETFRLAFKLSVCLNIYCNSLSSSRWDGRVTIHSPYSIIDVRLANPLYSFELVINDFYSRTKYRDKLLHLTFSRIVTCFICVTCFISIIIIYFIAFIS